MPPAIGATRVTAFVEGLFEEDLHAKRIQSLANATTGVLRAGTLGIHAIGRGLALARKTSQKHSVKQVDRLIGNDAIDVWALFATWVPYVVADRSEVWVALDWTEFEDDDHATLVASVATSHGRSTPLMWLTVEDRAKGKRLESEEKLLGRLREVLPESVQRVVIVMDRGFGDPARWAILQRLQFDFVSRIRANISVTNPDGVRRRASEWLTPGRRRVRVLNVTVTDVAPTPFAALVVARDPAMKEPWCLAATLADVDAAGIVEVYAKRFTIEESFRDIKDLRFGMGLANMRVSSPLRRDRLLLISALACALLTLLGAAGEAAGIDRHFKTNTSKRRQYSLFRQGCDYYEFLPGMRDEWATPLLEKFGELLAMHAALTKPLGLI